MTKLQAILKYAASAFGCRDASCGDCPLARNILCASADDRDHQLRRSRVLKEMNVRDNCRAFIQKHPEQFSPEHITEELL